MAKKNSVTYLGEVGSYSYQAAQYLFPDSRFLGFKNFIDVVAAVEANESDYAVIPVENSTSGRIPDVHKLLLTTRLLITSEYMLAIKHCLVCSPLHSINNNTSAIETIYSHPQGFIQCRDFLRAAYPSANLIETADTASAARIVAELNRPDVAAITSPIAAHNYKCAVIHENVADRKDNFTRFITLANTMAEPPFLEDCLTTLIFQVNHKPGALIKALQVFDQSDLNVLKLETYNISEMTQLPTFYIDVGAGIDVERMKTALGKMEKLVPYMKLLGSYKASPLRSPTSGFLPLQNSSQG